MLKFRSQWPISNSSPNSLLLRTWSMVAILLLGTTASEKGREFWDVRVVREEVKKISYHKIYFKRLGLFDLLDRDIFDPERFLFHVL